MVKKGNYCHSKELALRVLSEYGVKELPVNVADICRDQGITAKLYDPKSSDRGYSHIKEGRPIIRVSEREPLPFKRFICAHEMGHIMQGHVGQWGNIQDNTHLPKNIRERAAMVYAAELVMPQCILLKLGVTTADQIMELCRVPYRTAFYALKELERRKQKGMSLSLLEKSVGKQFTDYISLNKNQ